MPVVLLLCAPNLVQIERCGAEIHAAEIFQSDLQKSEKFVRAPQLWRAITRDQVGQFCWTNTVVLRITSINKLEPH